MAARPRPHTDTAPPAAPPAAAPAAAASRVPAVAVVLGVLAIAVFARLPSLGDGLWYDELAAWADYAARGPAHILTTYDDPANHVLQSLLTWASFEGLAGLIEPALAMRLPSLLVSLLAVGLIAWLARRVHGGRPGGDRIIVLAAILAAVCPVLALSGTEARGYAFMIAGAAGSTAAWIRWMQADGHAGRTLATYAACLLLGAWAHPVAAVVGAGHAAAAVGLAVAARRRAPLRGLIPVAVAAALTMLAYAPILDDMLRLRGTLARGGGGSQPGLLGPEGVHAILQLGGAWSTWALPGLVLLVAGVTRLVALARDGHRPAGLLLAAWLGGAAVAVLAVAGLGTWVYARFLLFLVPGALVAIATGLAWLLDRRPLVGRLALIAIIGGWTGDLISRGPRQPIREAANVVLERAAPGDAVHAIGLRQRVSQGYLGQMPYSWSGDHGATLTSELPSPPPRWVVMLYPQLVTDTTIEQLRERGYGRVARFRGWIDWGGGDVEVWERR
jgi:hypothetical protein